jgi:hypothetical protein
VTITLKDGGTLVGTVVQEDETSVTLRTASGAELKLPREAIGSRELRGANPRLPAASPFSDPNESRLMFAPTGRPLGKGNGYFSDHYVLFPGFAYGLTKNLSVAGGVSVIPANGISDQVFYVCASSAWNSAKASSRRAPRGDPTRTSAEARSSASPPSVLRPSLSGGWLARRGRKGVRL